jgi:hypothetical protein
MQLDWYSSPVEDTVVDLVHMVDTEAARKLVVVGSSWWCWVCGIRSVKGLPRTVMLGSNILKRLFRIKSRDL